MIADGEIRNALRHVVLMVSHHKYMRACMPWAHIVAPLLSGYIASCTAHYAAVEPVSLNYLAYANHALSQLGLEGEEGCFGKNTDSVWAGYVACDTKRADPTFNPTLNQSWGDLFPSLF